MNSSKNKSKKTAAKKSKTADKKTGKNNIKLYEPPSFFENIDQSKIIPNTFGTPAGDNIPLGYVHEEYRIKGKVKSRDLYFFKGYIKHNRTLNFLKFNNEEVVYDLDQIDEINKKRNQTFELRICVDPRLVNAEKNQNHKS